MELSITGGTAEQNAAISYTRDANDRIVRRDVATGTDPPGTALYGYSGDDDHSTVTCDANHNILTWNLELPSEVVQTIHNSPDPDTWDAPSARGDLVWTTTNSGGQVGDLHQYDPYGNPLDTTGTVRNQAVPDTRQPRLRLAGPAPAALRTRRRAVHRRNGCPPYSPLLAAWR